MRAVAAIVAASLSFAASAAHAAATFQYLPIAPPGESYCFGASTDAVLMSPDGSLVEGLHYRFNGDTDCVSDGVVWSEANAWTQSPSVGGNYFGDPFFTQSASYIGFSVDDRLAYLSSIDCIAGSCFAGESDKDCPNPGDQTETSIAPAGGVQQQVTVPDLTCAADLCPSYDFVAGRAISRDGTTVVGGSACGAFRWTEATGTVAISPPGQESAVATTVSGAGAVVAGYVTAPSRSPFVWSSGGGFQVLPVELASEYDPVKISADGTTVLGTARTPSGARGFLWTPTLGLTSIGGEPGSDFLSTRVADVSLDGSLVVGNGISSLGAEAFAWTRAGGVIGFGAQSSVTDMTPLGLVLAGNTVWNPRTGWSRSLEAMLAEAGIPVPDSLEAVAISDDGRTITGNRRTDFNQPWVATIDPPGVACDVEMSQAVYHTGDPVTITSLRYTNHSPTPTEIRLRLALVMPFATYQVIDFGAGGGVSLPGSFDRQLAPVTMFVLGDQPRGEYRWRCAIQNPRTNELMAEDGAPFTFE